MHLQYHTKLKTIINIGGEVGIGHTLAYSHDESTWNGLNAEIFSVEAKTVYHNGVHWIVESNTAVRSLLYIVMIFQLSVSQSSKMEAHQRHEWNLKRTTVVDGQ